MKNRAFTLIELLVVVLIIGVLTAIALPQYQKAVDKSRFSQAIIWAKTIRDAEQVYKIANGTYTNNLDDLGVHIADCPSHPTDPTESAVYNCDNGETIYFNSGDEFVDKGAVYVYLPGRIAAVIYHFDKDTRSCFAAEDNTRALNLCRNLGATNSDHRVINF